MRKRRIIGVLSLFLLPLFLWAGISSAQTIRTGDNATVPAGEVVDSTLWASGRVIDVAGEVNGDVICAGVNVSISGTVRGDVICAAQTMQISGTVEGDIRVAGQSVAVGADIDQNASVAAQSFSLDGDANVGGDLSVAGSDAVINGAVERDLAVASSNTTISGEVGRNVKATLESLTLTDGANIGGELTYTSANDADIAENAQVAQGTFRFDPPPTQDAAPLLAGVGFGFALFSIFSLLFTVLVLVLLFPRFFQSISNRAVNAPLKTFLVGLLAGFVAPVVIGTLMATVVGLPLAFMLLLAWIIVLFLSIPASGYYVGRLLFSKDQNVIVLGLAGTLILSILLFVPVLGFFVFLTALSFGIGMILRDMWRVTPKPRYDQK
jgi:cytoskeletal protein CcmA (bactofilin family)